MRKFKRNNQMCLKDRCFLDDINENNNEDDDVDSKFLQHFHKEIWNARFDWAVEKLKISKIEFGCVVKNETPSNYYYLFDTKDNENLRLGSDTLFTGFKNEELGIKEQDIPPDFHRLAHTFGGKIIFPKYDNKIYGKTINQKRGEICDRIDLTLKYIQNFYDSNYTWNINTLFNKTENCLTINTKGKDADENFFKLFGSFENFIEFFFLQDFVRGNQVIDLMKSENIGKFEGKLKLIGKDDTSCGPQIKKSAKDDYIDLTTDLGRWCNNSKYLIKERNKRIDDFIEKYNLQEKLKKIDPKYK